MDSALYDSCLSAHPIAHFSRDELLASRDNFSGVLGLISTILDPVDEALLSLFPNLKIVANYGAGFNNINVEIATARQIHVTNTPGVLSGATADLTWGLILATCRRMVESDKRLRQNNLENFKGWAPNYHLGLEVTGKTLGILGLGDIGRAVAKRAKGFDMNVFYHNRTRLPKELEKTLGVSYRDFDSLLLESHIVSIHTPLTPDTQGLFNDKTFRKMRPHAVLINTARGPIVDESALVQALKNGHLYAAGLDVFEHEPKIHPELLTLDNVVLTAHIGSATQATREAMGNLTLKNLMAVLSGHSPLTPVNTMTLK